MLKYTCGMRISERLLQYAYLMRLNRPIGILLLLWPTLWALWLAAEGWPDRKILVIFVAGVVLMRSAGCIMNDFADRHFDGHVQRTRQRPLASGKVSVREALCLAAMLSLIAFILVLQCNWLTVSLSIAAAGFALGYPFLKRYTHLPQLGLGVAYSFGVPMAFAAVTGSVNADAWFLFASAMVWPVIYDTMYAMVDKNDDIKIGVKSTAILFGALDLWIIAGMQIVFVTLLINVGAIFNLHAYYYLSLIVVCLLFIHQLFLIRERERDACFKAFLNNNWVGLVIFTGIFLNENCC